MAQNLQLHYDMGKDRHYFTSTIEMFKPDEYGSTYLFVDMDYNRGGNKSASLAYFEIARYVSLPFVKGLSATVQYNDGMIYNKDLDKDFPLGHVWLAGFSYPIDLGFVTLNTDLLYRADYLSETKSNAQVTTVWFKAFFDNRINFTGFMDIWSTKQAGKNQIVLLTEPQIWYNIYHHLAVGSEVEISNNFIPGKTSLQVNPTIAAKWTF
ncbi:MAG: DUF5020 family protein [Syntrophomonadaceae bacterium]